MGATLSRVGVERKQKTQPKGIDPKTGKPYEPIEIPPLKRGEFEDVLRRAAKGSRDSVE
jgi:hypothetical protein